MAKDTPKLQIENIDINSLIPYINNAKEHPKEQIDQIVLSIKRFGFNDPIAIDENNVIIEGHGRLLALKELGYKDVPIIKLSHLTEPEKKAYILAHNKLTMNTGFDMKLVEEEYNFLLNIEPGIERLTFFKEEEFIFEEEDVEIEEDDYEEPNVIETDIKLGDVIQLGDHRLMCGDSTETEEVNVLVEGMKCDMCFTDPPYLMDFTGGMTGNDKDGYKQGFNSKHDSIKNDKMSKEDGEKFLDDVNQNIKDFVTGAFYITFYRLGIGGYFSSLDRIGLQTRSLIIWEKGNHTLSNSDYMSRYEPMFYGWVTDHNFYGGNNGMDVWNIPRTKKNDLHPTMKPIELCAKAIENSSKQGQSVLDLFGGSGSTLIACEQLNRNCFMMELDEKYCEVICQRWEKLTGQKRKLLK